MSASLYDVYEISDKLAREGVWIEFPSDMRLLIARADRSNRDYTRIMRNLQRRNKSLNNLSIEEERGFINDILVNSLVLDSEVLKEGKWVKGLPTKDDRIINFTKETLKKLFRDLPEFAKDVFEEANEMTNFSTAMLGQDEKNL